MVCIRRLLEVEGYEQCKYHRLYEPHKHFKEIEWDKEDISKWESFCANFRCNPEHDSEEHCTGKYISEETEWEGHDTDDFSYDMEPTDDDIDNFINNSITTKIKKVVEDISEKSTKPNHDDVWDENHEYCHPEGRIDIRINRSEIIVPAHRRESEEPIERKAIEIRTENIEKCPPDKPECFAEWEIVPEKWFKKCFQIFHDEKSCCTEKARLALWSEVEHSWENRYDNDKNPCRKHSIGHIW